MKKTIIIRTFNHAKVLSDLLEAVRLQTGFTTSDEIIIADFGSTDGTLYLAEYFHCKLFDVRQLKDNPVAALNWASAESTGDILVFLDPLSIPSSKTWLKTLIDPIADNVCEYSYGRLLPSALTSFSHRQYLEAKLPAQSQIPQYGQYCHNANTAILKSTWERYRFDESLPALESIQMAKDIRQAGGAVAYVAEAGAYDLTTEDFYTLLKRFREEGVALQSIYPDIHFSLADFAFYWFLASNNDIREAVKHSCLHNNLYQILSSRLAQYLGILLGAKVHEKKSLGKKDNFLSPKKSQKN
jgi:glycosyltransferase involved in cell wall biosynthesis